MLPFLMMENTNEDDMLKIMLMMQTMGSGDKVVGLDLMMPYLMMLTDNENDNSLLTMVLLSSMTGGLNTPQGIVHITRFQK